MKRIFLLIAFGLVIAPPLLAKEAQTLVDPEIEERFRNLTSELRCVKCQNQSIFDSHAGVAEDLRRQIRGQMNEGKSDTEIVDYLVARYGDFVRYRPPLTPATFLLWGGPALFLIIGASVLITQLRKRGRQIADAPLDEKERQRVRALLAGKSGENEL